MQLLRKGKEALRPRGFLRKALMWFGSVADVVGNDAEGDGWRCGGGFG